MILHDARFYGEKEQRTISIEKGIIVSAAEQRNSENHPGIQLHLNGATILPGFINSHEHLDFNCFPALSNRIYPNYTEWGPDIQSSNKELIAEVQTIPHELRVKWGIYKNLLNGFTTVVNHGPILPADDDLITVFQEIESLHSPVFEKNWKWKLNNLFKISIPVSIHAGEGTDKAACDEIDELIKANKIGRKLIAVHGVAMNEQQARSFKGVVWCPASNFFFLGQTAAVNDLKKSTTVVFGTDSTLTSSWNCWEQFRQALATGMIDEKGLLEMLTSTPAGLWKLNDRGKLEAGKKADFVVVKAHSNLFNQDPADILLVVQAGEIRLIDISLEMKPEGFGKIAIHGNIKYVQGDPGALAKEIKKYYQALYIPFDYE